MKDQEKSGIDIIVRIEARFSAEDAFGIGLEPGDNFPAAISEAIDQLTILGAKERPKVVHVDVDRDLPF